MLQNERAQKDAVCTQILAWWQDPDAACTWILALWREDPAQNPIQSI